MTDTHDTRPEETALFLTGPFLTECSGKLADGDVAASVGAQHVRECSAYRGAAEDCSPELARAAAATATPPEIRSEDGAAAALMSMYADAPLAAVVACTSVYAVQDPHRSLHEHAAHDASDRRGVNMPHVAAAAHDAGARAVLRADHAERAHAEGIKVLDPRVGPQARTPNASSKCGQARNVAAATAQDPQEGPPSKTRGDAREEHVADRRLRPPR